ncbi:MlaC/ttg2D family ABC transporter substrate-binding protein [Amnimonas aquatica]|nr:ABC transporter substrate-binding protein [Amnimonas aquatica]
MVRLFTSLSSRLVLVLPALLLALSPLPAAAAGEANPQVVVKSAVDTLTARIVKERQALKSSPAALNQLVEQNITPFVDIPGIARGVMGQFYRQASDAQRARFTEVFKQSMVRTYANGLIAYDNEKIVFKPYRPGDDPARGQVDVEVTLDSGTVVPVTFQMQRDAQGNWKARNLIVNGLNLGLTFRKRFAEVMEQNTNNIDKAIAAWSPGPVDVVKDKK